MLTHTATVESRRISWDDRTVVQHGSGVDCIALSLDAEWDACDAVQVVLCGPDMRDPKRYMPDGSGLVHLPASLMEKVGPIATCVIGYIGSTARIVTEQEVLPLTVVESGATGPLDPGEDHPDLWGQMLAAEAARIEAELAREAAETARADAEAKRIAAEKARETASAEAVRAASDAAAKAEEAARQAESRVTAALAEVAKAEQARTEAEKARAAAESSRAEAEAARIAAESKRESAEAKRKADSAKAVADASAATSAANAAAGKADAAAQTATDGEASRVAAETARAKAEQARGTAETGRVEAEATRAAHESERTESFNTNLVSWNSKVDDACKKATDTASKAAQDAKTATDAAIAKTEEATNAAVAKAQTATDNATTAANKAEAAVSKLPLPLGNTLKGEAESTMVSVHDAYPAPLVTTKVMGQSNQLTTTGKNLFNWDLYIGDYAFDTSASGQGFYFAKIQVGAGKTVAVSVDKVVTSGEYLAFADGKFGESKKSVWLAHKTAAVKNGTLTPDAEGNVWIWFGNSKQNIQRLYDTGVKVQVEEGAKATAYEPYTGGKPSPSPDYPQEITNLSKAELVITGKNLLDESLFQEDTGNTNAPIFLAKGTYVISIQNDTKWWETASDKQTIFVHTFDTNEFVAGVEFTNLVQGKRSYGRLTINKDCNIKIYSYGGWAHKVVSKLQLEAGTEATTYKPHQSKSTVIDLKGNELCSLPNGVKDEVVIDAEGNVSLIKRTWSVSKRIGDMNNAEAFPGWKFTDNELKDYVGNGVDVEIHGRSTHFKRFYANTLGPTSGGAIYTVDNKQSELIAKYPEEVVIFIGERKEPQTIPLGKVELPALPEATSNVWNDGNIPANVYINYLKDVNIAFADLESKLTQAVVAAAANL